ncbi:hypothetical protein J437_LFUL003207 [Ladona fulva]|uniref:Uncharacterized protein n=1 Tax=Ladona fulva TaxID=123851 RepID=A0A8K0JXW5_LADFU|nr:hypothetical protein J437_LFUL003207 [Ladona fulva]
MEKALDKIILFKRLNERDVNDPKRHETVQLLNNFNRSGINSHVYTYLEKAAEINDKNKSQRYLQRSSSK